MPNRRAEAGSVGLDAPSSTEHEWKRPLPGREQPEATMAPPPDGGIDRLPERVLLLVLGAVGYFSLMFVWFSLPAYLPSLIEELTLTGTQAGVLAGAVPLTYVPLALVTGLVIDRIGARPGIGVAIATFALAQIGRAYAPGFASMLALTLLVGVGATGITFGLPKLAAELFPEGWIGTASSVYLVGASLGTATVFGLGRPVVGPLLGGWRPLFLVSGLAALLYAVVWGLVAWWTHGRGLEARGDEDGDESGEQATFTLDSVVGDLRSVILHREMALLVVIGTMYLLINHGLQGWLVTVFEAVGIPAAVGGPITSVYVGAKIVGVLSIPPLADRVIGRRDAVVGCGVLAAVGPLALAFLVVDATTATLAVIVVGLGVGGLSPLLRAIPVELEDVGPRRTATAVGLIFAVGEIGGFAGPVLIGLLHDLTGGFVAGLLLLAVGGAVVVAAGLAIGR